MCSGLLEMLKETSELTDGGWRWRFHWKTGGRVAYSKPFAGTSINKLLIIKDESLFMIERRCTQPPLPVPSIYTPPLASLHTHRLFRFSGDTSQTATIAGYWETTTSGLLLRNWVGSSTKCQRNLFQERLSSFLILLSLPWESTGESFWDYK